MPAGSPQHTATHDNADRVEVFAGIQRRRWYTADQKMAFVQEAAQPRRTFPMWPVEISRKTVKLAHEKKLISRLPSVPDEDLL
jgi:hypothetical protein